VTRASELIGHPRRDLANAQKAQKRSVVDPQ
jgi:hypothetical protein